MIWRVAEMAAADDRHAREVVSDSYGQGKSAKYPDFDLAFGYLMEHRHWHTKEAALNVVIKDAAAQLKKMRA